jgi:hypothetical protein
MLGGAVVAIAVSHGASGAHAQTTYDAVTDFTLMANPGPVWSYLVNGTLLGTPTTSFAGVTGWDAWDSNLPVPDSEVVARNGTGKTIDYLTIGDPTYLLNMDPESAPDVAVRFTAPTTGTYTARGVFVGNDMREASHPVEIRKNGVTVWKKTISAYNQKVFFSDSVVLKAGDVIDFACDTSPSTYSFLSTGFEAQLDGP